MGYTLYVGAMVRFGVRLVQLGAYVSACSFADAYERGTYTLNVLRVGAGEEGRAVRYRCCQKPNPTEPENQKSIKGKAERFAAAGPKKSKGKAVRSAAAGPDKSKGEAERSAAAGPDKIKGKAERSAAAGPGKSKGEAVRFAAAGP